jgi:DNA-binding NtrC family response regulator
MEQNLASLGADAHLDRSATIGTAGPEIEPPVLAGSVSAAGRQLDFRCLRKARREAIDRFEVEYVRALLERSEGNVTRAAAIADVSRQVIHKLIAKHRL